MMVTSASKDTLEIYPPEKFFLEAYRGMEILKRCHWKAGGHAMLSQYMGTRITLVLKGPAPYIASTMSHGRKMYMLNIAWRAKASGHQVTIGTDRQVPRL